jgi:diguanylate cyclase (GGDEF)-like protein
MLSAAQATGLSSLREDESAAATLLALTQASCLLELAKLSHGHLDLATWTRSAVDVIPQFFAVEGCLLQVAPPDLPAATASYGTLPPGATVELQLSCGSFVAAASAATLPFLRQVAEQLDDQLELALSTERLRRRSALLDARVLVAELEDLRDAGKVRSLAAALAAFPGAVGAVVTIDHRMAGGHLRATAGQPGEAMRRDIELTDGSAAVEVAFAGCAAPSDAAAVTEFFELITSALHRAEEHLALREAAEVDPLTGCGNRRVASRALAIASSRAQAMGESVAAITFDLDHFKRVNDVLGHPSGDEVLRHFAQGLRADVRADDVVCRMGGEEFLVVCPGVDAAAAGALADRIRSHVSGWCEAVLPDGWHQTVSVGVAIHPDPSESIDALLRDADQALYQAKADGRDRVHVHCGDGDAHDLVLVG